MARRKGNSAGSSASPQHEPAPASAHNAVSGAAPGAASVREDGAAVLISVRAKPRAHRDGLEAERQGAWPVSVRAAPSEGAANEAVVSVLARALGRPPSTCSLQRGHRSRDKVVRVEAMDAESARQKLEEFVSAG